MPRVAIILAFAGIVSGAAACSSDPGDPAPDGRAGDELYVLGTCWFQPGFEDGCEPIVVSDPEPSLMRNDLVPDPFGSTCWKRVHTFVNYYDAPGLVRWQVWDLDGATCQYLTVSIEGSAVLGAGPTIDIDLSSVVYRIVVTRA